MTINFTVRPLVEYMESYSPDLGNILDRGCYSSLFNRRGVTAGSILGALNSDSSTAIKALSYAVEAERYLEDSSGYVKVPKPSAVVVCLRSDVEIVVNEIFSRVKPASAVLFPSVVSLVDYYSVLDRDMLTQKRISHLVANKDKVQDTFVLKALADLRRVPKPMAYREAISSAVQVEQLRGEATVAIVLNAPLLVGGHYKLYEKIWLSNEDKVGNEPDYYEADGLIGELYQSCTRAESIQEEGCVKCPSSSTCAQTLLSNQNMPNVINAGFVWIEAKEHNTALYLSMHQALVVAEQANCIEVQDKLSKSELLNYVKPHFARSEEADMGRGSRISETHTKDLDLRQSNIDMRTEERLALKSLVAKATLKRKEHCSKCSMLDGCRPKGNKDSTTKFYSSNICKSSISKYVPKEPELAKVYSAILKNKYLYKAICMYSGSQLYYTHNTRRSVKYYKGGAVSIGHITSLESLKLLEIPYVYFGLDSKIQVSNNKSTSRAYTFSGYELSAGAHISLDQLVSVNRQGIDISIYKAIVRTGLLRMYEMPYEIDKNLEGWVARLIVQDVGYNENFVRGKASVTVYVPLQIALMGLGMLNPFPGSGGDLALSDEETSPSDRELARDYRDHMKFFRTPTMDKKALAMYVKSYDVVEYPVWEGGGFSSIKCRVHSNVSCSIKPGTGMLHITQYNWRIKSADDLSASTGIGLEVAMPNIVSTFVGTSKDSSLPLILSNEPTKNLHWYSVRRASSLLACMGGIINFRASGNRNYIYVKTRIGSSSYAYKKVKLVELKKLSFVGSSIELSKVRELAEALVTYYGFDLINKYLCLNYQRRNNDFTEVLDFTGTNIGKAPTDKGLPKIIERTESEILEEVIQVMRKSFIIRGVEILDEVPSKQGKKVKSTELTEKLLTGLNLGDADMSELVGKTRFFKHVNTGNSSKRRRIVKLTVLSLKDLAVHDAPEVLYHGLTSATPMAIGNKLGGMNLLSTVNRGFQDCYTGSEEALNNIKAISKSVSRYKIESLARGFGIRNDSYDQIITNTLDNVRRLTNANNTK